MFVKDRFMLPIALVLVLLLAGNCTASKTAATAQLEILAQPVPDWLLKDWALRTEGEGIWISWNDRHGSEEEIYEAYGIQWEYGLGNAYVRGRLYGLIDGLEAATFWEFTEYWDPASAKAIVVQIGSNGSVGKGELTRDDDGRLRLEQTFSYPGLVPQQIGHINWMASGKQHTQSYNIVDGVWEEDRYNVWERVSPPPVPAAFRDRRNPQEEAAQLLILGTFHFHNPGTDYAQNEVADILSAEKQEEIAELNRRLARFQPTKIALEKMPEENQRIQEEYQSYRQGEFELSENEVYQIGFRLGRQFDHEQLFLVDHPGGLNIDSLMRVAQLEAPVSYQLISQQIQAFVEDMNRRQREESLLDILHFFNQEEVLLFAQSLYANMTKIGQGDHYYGAETAAKWYERNAKIFANLLAIAEPGDRILLIVGQGHKPLLEQLARQSSEIQYVDVLDYLTY